MLATQHTATAGHTLLERLYEARQRSDEIFRLVRGDSLYERPIPERHRIIFYLGHLEAFDWNLLHDRVVDLKSFQPEFDRLFAFGIDPVGGGLPDDRPSDWPLLSASDEFSFTMACTACARAGRFVTPSSVQFSSCRNTPAWALCLQSPPCP